MPPKGPTFYEFFAGGGMARAGLQEAGFRCLFANDFDLKKVESYRDNWGELEVLHEDVRKVTLDQLPGRADLIWASFPCQDLSLAGGGAGLKGDRSGTFWPFWDVVQSLESDDRRPKIVVLENVCGTLTSHGGRDFAAISDTLAQAGFLFGAMVIDAAHFLPQSRPRVFFVAVDPTVEIPEGLTSAGPMATWHTKALVRAMQGLKGETKTKWVWWSMPIPARRNTDLLSVLDDSAEWQPEEDTARLIQMMAPHHRRKIEEAKNAGQRVLGTLYRRTRPGNGGDGVQRAEVRFDGVAGCLRTPAGGSSRQTLVLVENGKVRSRLLSAREAARLMGLDDRYKLPDRYNEAYHLMGDGVAKPVVEFLAKSLLGPCLRTPAAKLVA